MNYRQAILACSLVCWFGLTVSAQIRYPSTKYRGFSGSERGADWATSPPSVPDLSSGVDDYSSMSPDSWGQPSATQTPTRNQGEPSGDDSQSPDNTPDVPDLKSNSPFQSSSFPRPAVTGSAAENADAKLPSKTPATDLSPGSSRYPLNSATALPMRSAEGVAPFGSVETWYDDGSVLGGSMLGPSATYEQFVPNYRPDLGHRGKAATVRRFDRADDETTFDFENKKVHYPPMREILATGRYFGSPSVLYLKPAFQGNTAISVAAPGFGESIPFDFDYESAPHFRFGFESKYGPGIELDCWQYDETSNVTSFTSDGTASGTSSTWMLGPSRWSRLIAMNAGEQLDASHTVDVESFGVSFFKEMKFKISRLNGKFGFQYASITQSMDSVLSSGGLEIGRLMSRSDLNAWGPKFGLEYYRPVGHTKLELLTTVGGSVMFGHRDQFVSNTGSGDFDLVGADEFVTMVDFLTGVQYKKMTAENRALYARLGLTYQTWIGGGTAGDPQGDFGLRGFIFGVGYNR